jgi:hypothetical protein
MTSVPPFDCVVGYHLNPLTCGVAKFNSMLAGQLNIPVVPVFDERLNAFQNPLLSIKCSEFSDHDLTRLQRAVHELPQTATPWFFLHGFENSLTEIDILRRAAGVYCGSRKIFADVSPLVAHTRLLDAAGASYSLSMSTALHEGTSFEDAFTAAFDQLHAVFGEHVRFQGFLSDDAVLDQLKAASFFTAFFEEGVRDNNSSVVAAMEQGTVVITNLDAWSPAYMRHGETVLDINQLDILPTDPATIAAIAAAAREAVQELSWDRLIEGMA